MSDLNLEYYRHTKRNQLIELQGPCQDGEKRLK